MEEGMAWVDNSCSQFFIIEKFKKPIPHRYHVSHIGLAKTQEFNNTLYVGETERK